jgi:hypothetical protein
MTNAGTSPNASVAATIASLQIVLGELPADPSFNDARNRLTKAVSDLQQVQRQMTSLVHGDSLMHA